MGAPGKGKTVSMDTGTGDDQLLKTLREQLYVPVVSDVLDSLGFLDQAMTADVRPLDPQMRVIGRAHTVLAVDVYERPAEPYRLEIESIDALREGDVLVACTNGSTRTCFWGELLSTAAMARLSLIHISEPTRRTPISYA